MRAFSCNTLYVELGPRHGPVLDFLVADFQAAKQTLLTAGCTIDEEDRSVPHCYIRDRHGLVFNIEQRRAGKSVRCSSTAHKVQVEDGFLAVFSLDPLLR